MINKFVPITYHINVTWVYNNSLSLSLLFYLLWEQYHTLFPPPNLLSNWRIWHVLFSTLNTTSLSNLITIGCWEHNVNISFIPHALCIPWLHSQGLHNEHTLLRNVMNLLSNCRKGFRPPRCQVEYLGPLHTRDREPVTITLQTLSLVGKAKFYQVCFIICWRDQRSEWMQDGCNIYIDSYMASNGWSFLSTWTIVDNRLLETKNSGDHGTPNAHNHWFILLWSCVRTRTNKISLKWHLVEGPVKYDFTLYLRSRDHTKCLWDGLWTLSFGLSQFHGHGS